MRKGWESWDSSTWRRENLRHLSNYLLGGSKEDGTRLYSVVPTGMRGHGHKMKNKIFHFNKVFIIITIF